MSKGSDNMIDKLNIGVGIGDPRIGGGSPSACRKDAVVRPSPKVEKLHRIGRTHDSFAPDKVQEGNHHVGK